MKQIRELLSKEERENHERWVKGMRKIVIPMMKRTAKVRAALREIYRKEGIVVANCFYCGLDLTVDMLPNTSSRVIMGRPACKQCLEREKIENPEFWQ